MGVLEGHNLSKHKNKINIRRNERRKMKKKFIVGAGAVALGFAAMPMFGVFAASSITDTVQITINSSCSVGQTTSSTGTGKTMTEGDAKNGQTYAWEGTTGGSIKVSCNDASGWNIKAVGASTGTNKTAMTPTGSGTPIATGTATTGNTSNWAFKLSSTTHDSAIVASYKDWSAVPATATKVASGSTAISEGSFVTNYRVYVSPAQQADTYTGMVTYTVAAGVN